MVGSFQECNDRARLIGFNAPQAEAIEIVGGSSPALHMNDGLLSTVAARHGGGHRGGVRHGGAHRPAHLPAHRPGPTAGAIGLAIGAPSGIPPRLSFRVSRRGSLGRPSGLAPLVARRRHCGQRGDRLCHGGDRGRLGRRVPTAGPLLVLHRPDSPAGLLGRLPVEANSSTPRAAFERRLFMGESFALEVVSPTSPTGAGFCDFGRVL